MFITEFEKEETLWNMILQSYKNDEAKNESFMSYLECLVLL